MSQFFDFEPLKVAIFDWLNQAVNAGAAEGAEGTTPILRAEDDGMRPQEGVLFIEYKFLTGLVKVGMADEKVPQGTDPTKFILRGQRNITVSVTCFGTNAAGCMAQIQQSLSSPLECSILRSAGMSVRDDSAIADSSVFLETRFEERAVLDVIFGFTLESEIEPGLIESVEVTSKLPAGKKQTIVKNVGTTVEEPD